MAPVRNARVLMNEYPTGFPVPGKTTVYDDSQTIDIDNVPLKGGLLLKTLVLSVDPYMRNRMHSGTNYAPGFPLGQPLKGYGVGVVVRSEMEKIKAGDHIYGYLSHEEYTIHQSLTNLMLIDKKLGLPWSVYLGAAGMPGQTAFTGWKAFAHPKPGDVVYVTSGAGPVGSLVIQFAKADGLKVIASAGSDDKIAFMKEIGADVVFNYKTTPVKQVLDDEGPIDIFWDHVGGQTLDDALENANNGARFIECGMISLYNSGLKAPIHNLMQVIAKDITIRGFIVTRSFPKYLKEFYDTIPPKLASGELKYTEEVTYGLDKVGDVILAIQKGTNKAKPVVRVADG